MRKFECAYPGALHRYEGAGCQDSIYSKRIPGGRVVCLCDGAGSCRSAAAGSREMARAICLYAAEHFHALWKLSPEQLAACIERQIQEALLRMVLRYGGAVADYGSTLLCAAYRTETGEYLAIQLGDGIIASRTTGRFVPVFIPSSLQGTQSYLTTSLPCVIRANLKVKTGVASELLLTSDGGKNILYDDSGMINPIVETIASLLSSGCEKLSDAVQELIVGCYRPFDDFSMGLLCCEALPNTGAIGFSGWKSQRKVGEAGWNHRRIHQESRRRKAFSRYVSYNDAGKTLDISARKAHWGRRNRRKKQLQAQKQYVF